MVKTIVSFLAAGGNRHPASADWDADSGLLAFGAGSNVAIWDPLDKNSRGISALLGGGNGSVTAVKFFPNTSGKRVIIAGTASNFLRIWVEDRDSPTQFKGCDPFTSHQGSVNCLAVCKGSSSIVCGSADGTISIWSLTIGPSSSAQAELVDKITLKPRLLPLALALTCAGPENQSLILAVAGTRSDIQVFIADFREQKACFEPQAILTGHEGWIRSLSFTEDGKSGDHLLASASQDKYVRLWRLSSEHSVGQVNGTSEIDSRTIKSGITNKAYRLKSKSGSYSITFEALLFGHDDWIFSATWKNSANGLQLLTTSADNSLNIWKADPSTGIWISAVRLGEISAQKGATTATGSAGGYWIGLWSPDGRAVTTLGKTGSWRLWVNNPSGQAWSQKHSVSGHTKPVKSLAWSKDQGNYLLSTSTDQTTRLFAEWKKEESTSWHEFSRPQIHGYDLNCIDTLSAASFVSGADEKLLRVFDMPKSLGLQLEKLSRASSIKADNLPEAADIPVLGLSNKAIQQDGSENEDYDQNEEKELQVSAKSSSTSIPSHPPLEDSLSKLTLWPESEKLYGHGYEISAVGASHDGNVIATACRASSIDHAVIRLFRTSDWTELTPPLRAHSLTIYSLAFSADDKYLLSVGRDRQWAVFVQKESDKDNYELFASNAKGHSRMILDCSWAPLDQENLKYAFATAGRDKTVKIWKASDNNFECVSVVSFDTIPTALAFHRSTVRGKALLAVGFDLGAIKIAGFEIGSTDQPSWHLIDERITPSTYITRLSWRPKTTDSNSNLQLATSSDDHSTRVYSIDCLDMLKSSTP